MLQVALFVTLVRGKRSDMLCSTTPALKANDTGYGSLQCTSICAESAWRRFQGYSRAMNLSRDSMVMRGTLSTKSMKAPHVLPELTR